MNDIAIIFGYITFIYLVGFSVLSLLFPNITSRTHVFISIGLSWILGNTILFIGLFGLTYFNMLDVLSPTMLIAGLTITGITSLFSSFKLLKKAPFQKKHLYSLGTFAAILFVFSALIQHSLTAYLIDWDAVAIWFMKTKSIFISGGIWNNPYFQDTGLYDYSNKAYPIAIPIISAAYFKLIGFLNDQAIQFYFIQYFLMIVFMSYGFMRSMLSKVNQVLALLVSLGFFLAPSFILHAHNGYVDILLGTTILASMILFMQILNSHDKPDFFERFALLLVMAAFGASIKNEGLVFFTAITITSSVIIFWKIKKQTSMKLPSTSKMLLSATLIVLTILPILMWRYFLAAADVPFYLDRAEFSLNSLSKLKIIFNWYIHTILDTSQYSLSLIPALLLFVFQTTFLVFHKKYLELIPSLLIAFQLAVYSYVYTITTVPLNLQLETSFGRLTLHILPAFLAIIIYQQMKIQPYMKEFFTSKR